MTGVGPLPDVQKNGLNFRVATVSRHTDTGYIKAMKSGMIAQDSDLSLEPID
jgi:hypothetical protein